MLMDREPSCQSWDRRSKRTGSQVCIHFQNELNYIKSAAFSLWTWWASLLSSTHIELSFEIWHTQSNNDMMNCIFYMETKKKSWMHFSPNSIYKISTIRSNFFQLSLKSSFLISSFCVCYCETGLLRSKEMPKQNISIISRKILVLFQIPF